MKRIVLSIIIYVSIIAASCPNGGREECGGELRVVRELPDITMSLDDEPILIDVLADPPVFQQTANLPMAILAFEKLGKQVAELEIIVNKETNRRQIVKIKPINVGTNIIEILAIDNCGEMDITETTTFTVTVTN